MLCSWNKICIFSLTKKATTSRFSWLIDGTAVFKVSMNRVAASLSSRRLNQSGLFNIWWRRQEQGHPSRLFAVSFPPEEMIASLVSGVGALPLWHLNFTAGGLVWRLSVAAGAAPPLISAPEAAWRAASHLMMLPDNLIDASTSRVFNEGLFLAVLDIELKHWSFVALPSHS